MRFALHHITNGFRGALIDAPNGSIEGAGRGPVPRRNLVLVNVGVRAVLLNASGLNIEEHRLIDYIGWIVVTDVARVKMVGALGAAAENYQLNKVKFTIVRYDLPSEFYMSASAKLGSGGSYKLWFPNYSVQSCASVDADNKAGVNRTSISCRSLDWVLGTFRLPNYTTVEAPLNAMPPAPASLGPNGATKYTWEAQERSWITTPIQ